MYLISSIIDILNDDCISKLLISRHNNYTIIKNDHIKTI